MEFAVQQSTGAQKCSQQSCGETIPSGEPVFLTTTVVFGTRGSCLGFHPKCVQSDQVSSVVSDWKKVDGWEKISDELKEEVKTAFEKVLKNKDQKKAATPIKRKAEVSSKTSAAKSSKGSKDSSAGKSKGKAEKAKSVKGGPKKAQSAYMWFGAAERQNVIELNGGPEKVAPKEVMTLLGAAWRGADAETKKKYEELAEKDKVRYAAQKAEFDEKGTYTKTPEEIEFETTRTEKAKLSKEKSKQKAAAKKKAEAESKTAKPESKDVEKAETAEEGSAVTDEIEEANEEPVKEENEEEAEEEVDDADETAED